MPPAGPAPLSEGDERTWAMLAHLSVLLNLITGFLGVIAALAIYFIYKDRSRYVAYHAMQSFVMQLVLWAGGGVLTGLAWGATAVLSAFIVGLLCIPIACVITLFPLIAVAYGVWGGIETSQGKDFKYYWIGDWVRGTLTG